MSSLSFAALTLFVALCVVAVACLVDRSWSRRVSAGANTAPPTPLVRARSADMRARRAPVRPNAPDEAPQRKLMDTRARASVLRAQLQLDATSAAPGTSGRHAAEQASLRSEKTRRTMAASDPRRNSRLI